MGGKLFENLKRIEFKNLKGMAFENLEGIEAIRSQTGRLHPYFAQALVTFSLSLPFVTPFSTSKLSVLPHECAMFKPGYNCSWICENRGSREFRKATLTISRAFLIPFQTLTQWPSACT
jgi:hypothetical protein